MHRLIPIQLQETEERPRGVALILVMLSLAVLSVLAAAIVFTARTDAMASYNFKLSTQADYLAKAGIQEAINWFRSSRYRAVGQAQAPNFYDVSSSGSTYNLYTSNTSPARCKVGADCPNPGGVAQLIGISGTGSTNFPNITNAAGVPVATAFAQDLANVARTGDASNAGTFSINAVLLNYQTLNNGEPPNVAATPVETWLITSRAVWRGAAGSSASVAVVEETAVVQPLYFPSYGHAIYGYCSVTMQGSAGVCTDSFNSDLGPYGDGNTSVASGGCSSDTATNVIAAGAGVGANGGVTLGSNVIVAGNVTIGMDPTVGCTTGGFTGSTDSVLGQVLNGPHVDPPSLPVFPANFPTGAPSYSLTGGNPTLTLPVGAPASPAFGYPGTSPPYSWSEPCVSGQTCNGTKENPYLMDRMRMQSGGTQLTLVGGASPASPVYYDINELDQTGGTIVVAGYVVLNVKSAMKIAGSGISNGITSNIPPQYVKINYAGTSGVSLSGSGAVSAIIDAPLATITVGGGGSAGYMVGAVKANNIIVQGGYPVHYDMQLNKAGGTLSVMVTTGFSRSKH